MITPTMIGPDCICGKKGQICVDWKFDNPYYVHCIYCNRQTKSGDSVWQALQNWYEHLATLCKNNHTNEVYAKLKDVFIVKQNSWRSPKI